MGLPSRTLWRCHLLTGRSFVCRVPVLQEGFDVEAAFRALACKKLFRNIKLTQARQRLAFARCGHLADIDVMAAVCAALPAASANLLDMLARAEQETIVKETIVKKARWGRVTAVGKRVQARLQDIGFARSAAPAAPEEDLVLGE